MCTLNTIFLKSVQFQHNLYTLTTQCTLYTSQCTVTLLPLAFSAKFTWTSLHQNLLLLLFFCDTMLIFPNLSHKYQKPCQTFQTRNRNCWLVINFNSLCFLSNFSLERNWSNLHSQFSFDTWQLSEDVPTSPLLLALTSPSSPLFPVLYFHIFGTLGLKWVRFYLKCYWNYIFVKLIVWKAWWGRSKITKIPEKIAI